MQQALFKAQSWVEHNSDLYTFLQASSDWSEYAAKLVEDIQRFGSLTPNQYSTAQRMKAKIEARKAEEAAKVRATLDLTRINTLFATAKGNGLKRPALNVGRLRITEAPLTGRNAGCLYVKDAGDYAGKITGSGKYYGLREARPEIEAELIHIAADPIGSARAHGLLTGQCSCCGRHLSDPESVAAGIGPVCAVKWGM